DVLPEIGQLQCGAGVIGKTLTLRITVSTKIKDQMADRIRRVAAIAEQIVKRFISGDGLVLTKRLEQICKWLLGNIKCADGFGQSYKYRMPGTTGITCIEFCLPLIQQQKRSARIADFVAQVV